MRTLLFLVVAVTIVGCASVKPWLWRDAPQVLTVRKPITVKVDAFGIAHLRIPPGEYRFVKQTEDGRVYVADGVKFFLDDALRSEQIDGGLLLSGFADSVYPVRIIRDKGAFDKAGELPRYFLAKAITADGFATVAVGRPLSSDDRVAIGLPAEGQQREK